MVLTCKVEVTSDSPFPSQSINEYITLLDYEDIDMRC